MKNKYYANLTNDQIVYYEILKNTNDAKLLENGTNLGIAFILKNLSEWIDKLQATGRKDIQLSELKKLLICDLDEEVKTYFDSMYKSKPE